MNNKYKVKEIIAAVDLLLGEKENKLKLLNEVKDSKKKLDNIPQNTEKIILQAEKYLKKKSSFLNP